MSTKRRGQTKKWDQQGTVAVITAAGLLLLLGIAGLALDLGHLFVVKSELQRAADAGAMAGARALFFPANSSPPRNVHKLSPKPGRSPKQIRWMAPLPALVTFRLVIGIGKLAAFPRVVLPALQLILLP